MLAWKIYKMTEKKILYLHVCPKIHSNPAYGGFWRHFATHHPPSVWGDLGVRQISEVRGNLAQKLRIYRGLIYVRAHEE